jgi:hypothetical protein
MGLVIDEQDRWLAHEVSAALTRTSPGLERLFRYPIGPSTADLRSPREGEPALTSVADGELHPIVSSRPDADGSMARLPMTEDSMTLRRTSNDIGEPC